MVGSLHAQEAKPRNLATVTTQYQKRAHKFGIEISKTFDDCVRIDRENGNTLWQDAIRKEMTKEQIPFQTLGNGKSPAPRCPEIRCHLIFDVKMEHFQRKARLVAGGHMTEMPAAVTYASVVSHEAVRIAFTLHQKALNVN
jgi:hypothetical protein